MKIVQGYPPNIDEIRKVFQLQDNTVFTYGDTVYSPLTINLDEHLKVHEQTHMNEQALIGAEAWWKLYLKDIPFRLAQELAAYAAQYKSFSSKNKDRNVRARFLHDIAMDLSSSMYGKVINYSEAGDLILKLFFDTATLNAKKS